MTGGVCRSGNHHSGLSVCAILRPGGAEREINKPDHVDKQAGIVSINVIDEFFRLSVCELVNVPPSLGDLDTAGLVWIDGQIGVVGFPCHVVHYHFPYTLLNASPSSAFSFLKKKKLEEKGAERMKEVFFFFFFFFF